jgi:hypothetical protein
MKQSKRNNSTTADPYGMTNKRATAKTKEARGFGLGLLSVAVVLL